MSVRLVPGVALFLVAVTAAAEPPATDRLGDALPAGAVTRIGTWRLRHPDCEGMAWSGNVVVTWSEDLVRVWDQRTGKELRRYSDDTLKFTAAALAPDGKTLAVAVADGDILLWDTSSDKEPRRLSGHLRRAVALAFSRDGGTLASASFDRAGLWDVASGKMLHALPGQQLVRAVAIAPDGQSVATGDLDGLVIVWDAKNGKERIRGEGKGAILDLAFAPDGKTLASADVGKRVRLWDPATGKERLSCVGHDAAVAGVAFSSDGKTVVSGSADGTLHVWDTQTGKELAHPGRTAAAFVPLRFRRMERASRAQVATPLFASGMPPLAIASGRWRRGRRRRSSRLSTPPTAGR